MKPVARLRGTRTLLAAALLALVTVPSIQADILVPTNSVWRFFRGTSEASDPPTAWRTNTFDDSSWETGPAPFYFGVSRPSGTELTDMRSNYTCVFLRHTFVLSNGVALVGLTNRTFADDGFITWINGIEVRRFNVAPNTPGTFVAYDTNAINTNFVASPIIINSFTNALRPGTNVLAVQVFNVRRDDFDFHTNPELTANVVNTNPPAVASATPAPGSTVNSLTEVTVVFSKGVTGVSPEDFLVNGQPSASVSGSGTTYTFQFPQPAAGIVLITWDGNHTIADDAGRRMNEANNSWTYTFIDTVAPAVAVLTPPGGSTVGSLTSVEVQFNEMVSGVNAADLLVNGAPGAAAYGSGAGPYLFQFTQPATGVVQLAWSPGHGISDQAMPANAFAGGNWTVTLNPALFTGDVIINEVTAANVVTNGALDLDEFNEPEDWIELYNRGANAVRLLGWSLTDSPNEPGLWTFPDVTLNAGQYLVVYASGLDRKVLGGTNRLHTNFRLNPDGEYLALFNAESPRRAVSEFSPAFPEQRNDYSYGMISSNTWRYFNPPTPGAANGSSTITNVVPEPHVNAARGYFTTSFVLVASCELAEATMRYTTDGSPPLGTSTVFPGSLTISNTTVLRIAAFQTGMLPSKVSTHSYLFLDQVVNQSTNPPGFPSDWGPNGSFPGGRVPADYGMDMDPLRVDPNNASSAIDPVKLQRLKDGLRELPIVSIVMKTDDIFGTQGLYQRSAVETGTPNTKPQNKKPCSIEMILPDGTTAFTTTCGIDLHGNASRNPIKNPKHGFKLNFRGDFGPPALQYRLFEDSPVEEFDDLLLRPDFNSSWRHWSDTAGQGLGAFQRTRAVRIRDAWMKEAMRDMGGLASHSRFFHLYLNGLYWGTFEFSEEPTQVFAKNALGGSEADFDIVDQGAIKSGTLTAYNAMTALPAATTLAAYDAYRQYLDLVEFTDYMLLHFLMGHQDWATSVTKNWYALRKRVSGPEGTFKYLPWDGECILLNADVNRVTVGTPPSGLHTKLDDSPEYRLAFADRVHRHMVAPGGMLTPQPNIARWQKWQAVMDKPIVGESVRWGDYRRDVHPYSEGVYQLYTRENHVLAEHVRMLGYFSNRTATVLGQLRSANLYPAVSAPVFNQQGGRVPVGFSLTLAATNTIYYTTNGADPRTYGSGAVSPFAQAYSGAVTLDQSVVVKARALFNSVWSALNEATFTAGSLGVPIRITEIMYNPVGGDAFEYVELQNIGTTPLNIGSYNFSGITFTFSLGTTLQAGQRIILGSGVNTNLFKARYPGVPVAGWFGGSLANGGEPLVLKDGFGNTILSVDYDDESGWPVAADGSGYSLEIVAVNGDPDDPANWRASNSQNGSPGQPNSSAPAPVVLINEVMADNPSAVANGATYPDWVELRNPDSSGAVNIGGWSLTDDGDARQFIFPAGTTIPAGGFLVVWCDSATNTTPGLHTDFALGRNGDNVFLYDASTSRVDGVSFGPQAANYSLGRIGGSWVLTTPTPNAENSAATLTASTNVVINEWLANAAPGGADWIELFNTASDAPASLHNIYLGTSNALFQVRALSFLAPRGYVQFFADEQPGGDHVDFKLPSSPGAIVLYDTTGAQIQRVTYGAQAEGVSQGRLPDGTASIAAFPGSASGGSSNYLISYTGPVLNEVLARNSRAVISPFANYADYIELFNAGGAAFNLGGYGLSDDAGEVKFIFAPGTMISAGGYLVVWCDGNRDSSASAPLNAGFSLSGASGGVYLFNTFGQAVNSIEYGFQVEDLPIGLSGGQWRLLASATPGAVNPAPAGLGSTSSLRINEWLALNTDGDDWFELYNGDVLPVDMSGLTLTDDPSLAGVSNTPIAALSFIAGKGWVQWIADGNRSAGRDHANFSLDAAGELIRLYGPNFSIIDSVSFGLQTANVSEGRLPDGGSTITSFPTTPTPEESNYLPLSDIVINEVLTHTDAPFEDAIEIQNIGSGSVAIGDWWISNSQRDLKRYRIPAGTTLAAGQFKVFYENQFNANGTGTPPSFTLNSAHGDTLYLSQADGAGNLSGYRAAVSFGAAENPVSFGRFVTSVGADFVAMAQRTFGADNPANVTEFRTGTGRTNSYPKVGPVILSEINYHPVTAIGTNVIEVSEEEFVELHNLTGADISLFDPLRPTNRWKLGGGISFAFPANTMIPAGGYLIVANFDPANGALLAAFQAKYGSGATILGPFQGRLGNGADEIELYRPDAPQQPGDPDAGFVPQILVDRVVYSDVAPWPTAADGGGASLQRIASTLYGNEPLNWKAEPATAGLTNSNAGAVAPTIATQPQPQTLAVGGSATFTVAANGTAPLSYQWQRDGADLIGAIAATLTLNNVQPGSAGTYRVIVSNSAGSITSLGATLTVIEPPLVSVPPQSQTIVAGNPVMLTVTASGSAPLHYQWRFNGSDLAEQTSSQLTINNVQPANAGSYSVVITNLAGSVMSGGASLTVLVPPTITGEPADATVQVGATASFTVAATGTAPLSYQWLKDGANISDATSATFNIAAAQPADEGFYSVIVMNSAGSVTSAVARLVVTVGPILEAPHPLADGSFMFLLRGESNRSYFIDFSANLSSWTNLGTVTLSNTVGPVVDSSASNAPARFYRARLAP